MSRREFVNHDKSRSYGLMGESVGYGTGLHIGDVVAYKSPSGDDYFVGIIVKPEEFGEARIMGYVSRELYEFPEITKVLPYDLVTRDIAMHLHSLDIVEPKKMTLKEIEKELGYSIEIIGVGDDNQ